MPSAIAFADPRHHVLTCNVTMLECTLQRVWGPTKGSSSTSRGGEQQRTAVYTVSFAIYPYKMPLTAAETSDFLRVKVNYTEYANRSGGICWNTFYKYIFPDQKTADKDRIRCAKTNCLLPIKEHQVYKLKNYITPGKRHRVTFKKAAIRQFLSLLKHPYVKSMWFPQSKLVLWADLQSRCWCERLPSGS